jgi:alpha-tubulin suppressor-like RCC1 family protein
MTCHRDVLSIATAADHSCAVLGDGRVYCWGSNTSGQVLGSGTAGEVFTSPVQVAGITNAVKVAAEYSVTCVVTTTGGVTCWGQGYIGDGTTTEGIKLPTPVVTSAGTPLAGVIGLAAGSIAACASTATNLYCWGSNLGHGLGVEAVTSGLATPVRSATPVIGAPSPKFFSVGYSLQVATFDGFRLCPWGGSNDYRQITSSSCTDCGKATDFCFDVGPPILQIGAAISHACARHQTGIVCWGDNGIQQLGTMVTSAASVGPPGTSVSLSAIDMQVYANYVCVLLSDGVPTIKCWGGPYATQQPLPPPYTAPFTIPASFPAGVKAASLGDGATASTTCLIATDGSPWCFGRNLQGQVGNSVSGSVTLVGTPTQPTITW